MSISDVGEIGEKASKILFVELIQGSSDFVVSG